MDQCAKRFYLRDIFHDAYIIRRLVLSACQREKLRHTFRNKHGAPTFAAGIFVHNRGVGIFIYAVSLLQIRATDTGVYRLSRRKFVHGVLDSPACDNVFKQVAGGIGQAYDGAQHDNFFRADGYNFAYCKFDAENFYDRLHRQKVGF